MDTQVFALLALSEVEIEVYENANALSEYIVNEHFSNEEMES